MTKREFLIQNMLNQIKINGHKASFEGMTRAGRRCSRILEQRGLIKIVSIFGRRVCCTPDHYLFKGF